MSAAQVLGWVLGVGGAFGMLMAGRKRWEGWAIGLALQPVWMAFALLVHSYGLLLSPVLYGSVYARNLWRWRHDQTTLS